MQRDLVEQRGWIVKYETGRIACPGFIRTFIDLEADQPARHVTATAGLPPA